ncbi:MAG: protein kinase [Deltaproteobacteria bacterium]|nr:protein kinase [Deltaproteobacteria bacterium]
MSAVPMVDEDAARAAAMVGRVIAGKYELTAVLGSGAMGTVYRARQISLDKFIALKLLHRDLASDARYAARFHREARAASRLEHPNSMAVLDFGEDADGTLYIAMEYLSGRDLHRVLVEEGPLHDGRTVEIMAQVTAALVAAHEGGIIHRDLKPENIILQRRIDDDGIEVDLVKVCDFGIAKIQDPRADGDASPENRALTTRGVVIGTPDYMSPEQARGHVLDARSDLYAIGVIMYRMVTGRLPFDADSSIGVLMKHLTEAPAPPRSINPSVDPRLEAIILRCMAKRPEERFANARELRTELRALGADLGLHPLGSVVPLPPRRGSRVPDTREQVALGPAVAETQRSPSAPSGMHPIVGVSPSGRHTSQDGSSGSGGSPAQRAETMQGPAPTPLPSVPRASTSEPQAILARPEPAPAGLPLVAKLAIAGGGIAILGAAAVVVVVLSSGSGAGAVGGSSAPIAAATQTRSTTARTDDPAPPTSTTPPSTPGLDTPRTPGSDVAAGPSPSPVTTSTQAGTSGATPGAHVAPETAPVVAPTPETSTDEPRVRDRDRDRDREARDRRVAAGTTDRVPTTTPAPAPVPAPVAAPPAPTPAPPPAPSPPVAPTQRAPTPTVAPTQPRPAPVPTPPPPAATRVVRASVDISGVEVDGPTSSSVVRRGLQRARAALTRCYVDAATRAGRSPGGSVDARLTFDERGRATQIRTTGGPLPGVAACARSALGAAVIPAPDTGTVDVSFSIRFFPEG